MQERALSGAIGPDYCHERAAVHLHREMVDGWTLPVAQRQVVAAELMMVHGVAARSGNRDQDGDISTAPIDGGSGIAETRPQAAIGRSITSCGRSNNQDLAPWNALDGPIPLPRRAMLWVCNHSIGSNLPRGYRIGAFDLKWHGTGRWRSRAKRSGCGWHQCPRTLDQPHHPSSQEADGRTESSAGEAGRGESWHAFDNITQRSALTIAVTLCLKAPM